MAELCASRDKIVTFDFPLKTLAYLSTMHALLRYPKTFVQQSNPSILVYSNLSLPGDQFDLTKKTYGHFDAFI
uniref:Uncharacterized protein n=1 Tax=Arundo donax TaxID=35708 RepID=A0A0A9SKE3_ARUDO